MNTMQRLVAAGAVTLLALSPVASFAQSGGGGAGGGTGGGASAGGMSGTGAAPSMGGEGAGGEIGGTRLGTSPSTSGALPGGTLNQNSATGLGTGTAPGSPGYGSSVPPTDTPSLGNPATNYGTGGMQPLPGSPAGSAPAAPGTPGALGTGQTRGTGSPQ